MGRALRPWIILMLFLIGLYLTTPLVYLLVVLWHEGVMDAAAIGMDRTVLLGCAVGAIALLAIAVLFITGRK